MGANFAIIFLTFLLLFIPNQLLTEETEKHHAETGRMYEETEEWGGHCQTGERQSPIDIQTDWFAYNKTPEIKFGNYEKNGNVTITNNGHSVVISGFDTWTEQPYISEGGLGGKYMLRQFHFHWSQNGKGSEHTVEGMHYDAELHLVHIKEGLSLFDALALSDGVAVLGVFYKIGPNGRALSTLQNGIRQVINAPDKHVPIEHYVPGILLPDNLDTFFRYNGSLTTPNCNEAAIWTIFAMPKSITRKQVQLLRALKGHDGKPTNSNVRPVRRFNRKP